VLVLPSYCLFICESLQDVQQHVMTERFGIEKKRLALH
jgi:hypothetical protein